MSDEVSTAAITGAVGVVASIATYLVSRGSAAVAMRTADKHAEVEIAKFSAENERLRQQIRETERSNRRDTYQRLLAVLDRMDMFATGYNPKEEAEYMVALEQLNNLIGGVHLFGADNVRHALGPLTAELERLGLSIARQQHEDPSLAYAVAYGNAYRSRWLEMTAAAADLTEAMREDVTRDILEPGAAGAITSASQHD
jgi:hypothetical protein